MAEWTSDLGGHMIQQGARYKLSYNRTDSSLIPWGVAEHNAFADWLDDSDAYTLVSVTRDMFDDNMQVELIAEASGPVLEVLDGAVHSGNLEAELAGSVVYELERIKYLGVAGDQERQQARERESVVAQTAGGGGDPTSGLAGAFDQLSGVLTLATVGVGLWAVGKAADAAGEFG